MTTDKPEVTAWIVSAYVPYSGFQRHVCLSKDDALLSRTTLERLNGEVEETPLILLSDYEALQAKCESLQASLRMEVEAGDSWKRQCLDTEDERDGLSAECEQLRKYSQRSETAFCAVIEYMLGDGRHEEPLEFLRYWTEGDFESVKEGWPKAPAVIYYADPAADHDAIHAASQEASP